MCSAAAFEGVVFAPFVGDVVFEGGEEVGAEASLVWADGLQVVPAQEAGEESLGEVFGVGLGFAAPPEVGVEWVPVVVAEGFERVALVGGGGGVGCAEDD